MQLIKMERVPRRLLLVLIIVGLGIFGYFGTKIWRDYPEILQQLPAAILESINEAVMTQESIEEIPDIPEFEELKYIEKAEKGEGLTHLTRRALKKYLQQNSQSFEATPEHKIYIEDYIAKKKGGRWLNLGEEVEISESLLKEAIEKAKTLSSEQLQNLEQYSQLLPTLNY